MSPRPTDTRVARAEPAPAVAPDPAVAEGAAAPAAEWIVRSPGVGLWTGAPEPGQVLGEGSAVGTLTQLNRRFGLTLGGVAAGRVVEGAARAHAQAVEYGQELFRLQALGGVGEPGGVPGGFAAGAAGTAGLVEGDRPLLAPTDGVFYRKPAPDAPVLIKAGDRVRRGQPVGLIEVMKTFNQILYEGAQLPEEALVIEVRVEDATEVRAGDVLLVVRGG